MLISDIKKYLSAFAGELTKKNGLFVFNSTLGERKTFLNQNKVSYTAKFRILDDKKLLKFTEIIKESGSGFSVFGDDFAPGVGFKKETYKASSNGREGVLSEKSNFFGKTLEASIDYKKIRGQVKALAEQNGYKFKYIIFPWGV